MKNSFLQLHSAILLAACSSIFGNLISLNAVLITWYRMLFAGLMFLLVLIVMQGGLKIRTSDRSVLITGVLLALHWTFFYASIKFSNVSVGVVCFCLSGFFTAIVSPIVNRRRVSISELLLSSLTLAGISLIFHFDSSFRTGIIFGVVSSLLFAIYATVNERVNRSEEVLRTTTLQMIGGSVGMGLLLPLYLYYCPQDTVIPALKDFGFLLLLAFGCTVCMCTLLNKAQRNVSAFTVSLSFNLEPIYSIILAIFLFHEDKVLSMSFYVGLSLILLSLVLQMVRVSFRKKTETALQYDTTSSF